MEDNLCQEKKTIARIIITDSDGSNVGLTFWHFFLFIWEISLQHFNFKKKSLTSSWVCCYGKMCASTSVTKSVLICEDIQFLPPRPPCHSFSLLPHACCSPFFCSQLWTFLVPATCSLGQLVLCCHEDQGDLLVSSSQQRKHALSELGGSGEAVNLRARLCVIKRHLTLIHIKEDAHLSQLDRSFHLQ